VLPDFDKAPGEGDEEEPLGGVVGDEKGTGGFATAGAAPPNVSASPGAPLQPAPPAPPPPHTAA
jgi:hypothetical protein